MKQLWLGLLATLITLRFRAKPGQISRAHTKF